jgi:uncharacterized membrane protein
MRKRWLGFVVAALAALLSVWAYPQLPPRIATHWNIAGQPNGYSSRAFAALLLPLMILGVALLFQVLPKLDPRRDNYAKFADTYWLLANSATVFLLAVHGVVIAHGLGRPVSVQRLMPIALGLLFVVVGTYLTRVEPNWFVGIRTPWTLSSEAVWRKTHRTAGRVFVVGGFAVIAESLLPPLISGLAVAGTLLVLAVAPIVQSYVLWRREQHRHP